ncbi:MAG: TonB-dependent receptor, partial [Bacteroidota bacterium]
MRNTTYSATPRLVRKILSFALTIFSIFSISYGQTLVRGTVANAESLEPLVGARIILQKSARVSTLVGANTSVDGSFQFESPVEPPFNVMVTYLGFDTLVYEVNNLSKPLKLRMQETGLDIGEVEITASAIEEAKRRSPLTVESMGIKAIKETSAANFYEGLGHLKGVDMNDASLGFKVVNTRGFNSTQPVRSLQLIDGVDNQSPGLNFSLGNFLGASELDLESVTLVVGASSAFYGPNAFNGVISMKTKSPFIHRGLSASVKVGERNLIETAVRYAKVFKNSSGQEKFAIKLNLFYMQADDWEARNFDESFRDTTELGTTPFVGEDNPGGYDAVNIYGDEVTYNAAATGNDRINLPGLNRYYRTGYKEEDLLDYDTDNIKAGISLHYKLAPNTELIASSNFSQGTTVFQGVNRISLRDIQFFQHKLEIKNEDRFFIRAYATHEDAANSYDPV